MKISIQKLVLISLALLAAGLLLGWLFFSSGSSSEEHSHPEVINSETVWTCSMHPQIRQNEPGQCPICGMDLISLEEGNDQGADPLSVSMSPTAMQLASVATAEVGTLSPIKTLQLNGKVQEDERLVFSQTSHFPGRIERLMVNFTGEYVAKGQPIAYLYSPELVTAQQELFEAYKIRENQPQLYQAARGKLKNWKLTENQIDKIIHSGRAQEEFPINADYSGYVLEMNINLGDHVMAGESIYEVANLSRVWVLFDSYESDLSWIKEGDLVEFTVASLPGKTYQGNVEYIDPVIDPKTRVAQARVVVQNEQQLLKPGMFASGFIRAELKEGANQLIVPKSAVLWTGRRSVVYVKASGEPGFHFSMREVVLGPALEDSYVVEDGLMAGEEIAVSGTFSIDAAAQLAGKPSMMARQTASPEQGATMIGHNHGSTPSSMSTSTPETHDGHQMNTPLEVNKMNETYEADKAFNDQLSGVFASYLLLKDALIASKKTTANNAAKVLVETLEAVDVSLVKEAAQVEWMKDWKVLKTAGQSIASAKNIDTMRLMLSPLSDQLYHSLKKYQVEVDGYRQYCPMARDNTGAFWLSESDEILNPYFGEAMLTCGETVGTIIE